MKTIEEYEREIQQLKNKYHALAIWNGRQKIRIRDLEIKKEPIFNVVLK